MITAILDHRTDLYLVGVKWFYGVLLIVKNEVGGSPRHRHNGPVDITGQHRGQC